MTHTQRHPPPAAPAQGPSYSMSNNYRFAAAEFAEKPAWKPRAISIVVLGGVVAAAVGPESARHARYMLPVEYAGCYVVMIILYVVQFGLLACLDYRLLAQLAGEEPQQQQLPGSRRPPGLARNASSAAYKPPTAGLFLRQLSARLLARSAPPGGVGRVEEEEEEERVGVPAAARPHSAAAAEAAPQEQEQEAGCPPPAAGLSESAGQPDTAINMSDVSRGAAAAAGAQDGTAPAGGAQAAAARQLSLEEPGWRELLLSWRFVLPAVTGGLSFCAMVALMSGTPVEMALAGWAAAAPLPACLQHSRPCRNSLPCLPRS
jgi:hypothetical protein